MSSKSKSSENNIKSLKNKKKNLSNDKSIHELSRNTTQFSDSVNNEN